jgi:hypothetical protein
VVAERQLQVPALVVTALAAAQRDPARRQAQILGVEVGGPQDMGHRRSDPRASPDLPQVGQCEIGLGVVLVLQLDMA